MASCSHEIVIDDINIKPEIISFTNFGPLSRIERVIHSQELTVGSWTIGFNDPTQRKLIEELIERFDRQRIADRPSV